MMKIFFKTLTLFLLSFMALIAIFSYVGRFLIKKNILITYNFKLEEATQTLLIGDSHVGLSLHPDFIENSENQYIIGEHYLYTYSRLKYFIKNNPQIKRVILGYSYSNITANIDQHLFDSHVKNNSMPKSFVLFGEDEIKILYANDLIFYRNYLGWKLGFPTRDNIALLFATTKKNYDRDIIMPFRTKWTTDKSGPYITGNTEANYKKLIHPNKITIFECDKNNLLSDISVKYLYKIIHLCKEYDIQLILYTSPLHEEYLNKIPPEQVIQFDSLSKELKNTRMHNLYFINYADKSLADSCFKDGNHLSGAGAKIISQSINEDLKSLPY